MFRSYKPTDEGLAENVMERIQPIDVDEQVKNQLELGKSLQLISDQVVCGLIPFDLSLLPSLALFNPFRSGGTQEFCSFFSNLVCTSS